MSGAGGFLAEDFQERNDLGQYPQLSRRQRRDPLAVLKSLEALDEQEERARRDRELLNRIQTGQQPEQPRETGFGGLRKAEAEMAEQERLADPEARQQWLAERDAQITKMETDLDAFMNETLQLRPGVDDIRRRAEIIDIERANIQKAKEQQAELWADLERAKHAPGATGNLFALMEYEQNYANKTANPLFGGFATSMARKMGLDKWILRLQGKETLEERLQNDETYREEFIRYAVENRDAINQLLKAYQAEAQDPSVIEQLIANSPLAAMQETLAGLASLPAEGLASLLGTDERGRFDEQIEWDEALLNLNPFGLMANAVGVGTSDSALRRRGREMNEKVGENLLDLDLNLMATKGISPLETVAGGLMPAAGAFGAFSDINPQTKKLAYQLGFELSTDPLNFIDFGGSKITKPSKILSEVAETNKWLAPFRKFWKALGGAAKDARAIGDPKLTEAHLFEQAFAEGGIGPEALRIAQDARAFNADMYSRLGETKATQTLELLPGIVERTKKLSVETGMEAGEIRKGLVEASTTDEVVRQALHDAADFLDDLNLRAREMENAFGGHTAMLDSDYGYYMTIEDPRFTQWKAENPTAQKILSGVDGSFAKDQWNGAMMSWERGRIDEWRHLDFYEKEAKLREVLRARGLPDSVPIFSRDAFMNMAKRAETSMHRLKQRAFYVGATEAFATKGADDVVLALAEQAADEKQAKAWARVMELEEELAKRKAVGENLVEGQRALRKEIKAAGKHGDEMLEGAEQLGRLSDDAAQVGDAVKQGNTLRRIFSKHPNLAELDEADRTVKALVDQVAKDIEAGPTKRFGTKFSRGQQRTAKQAVKTFEKAYKSAETKQAARNAIKTLLSDLRANAPKKLVAEYERLAQKALDQVDKLSLAAEKIGDRKVLGAVKSVEAGARRDVKAGIERAVAANIEDWTATKKAAWVEHVAKKAGHQPPPGYANGLDIYRKAGVELPNDLASLARLATSYLSPDDVATISKWVKDFYGGTWIDNATVNAIGTFLDGLKVIYQRSLLSRPPSMMRDFWGQLSQAIFAADGPEFADEVAKAVADLGGNPHTWAKGLGTGWKAPDDVLQLMSEGVLNTTVDEATQVGNFDRLAEGAAKGGPVKRALEPVLRGLGTVERKGVLGAALQPVSSKLSDAAKTATDLPLHARVWTEQTLRLATYRQAVKKGMSHREAVEEVMTHWGRFNELTSFDRHVLSRILFFWAWRRATIPIALKNLLDYPVRSKIILTSTALVHNEAKENASEIDQAAAEAGVPEWFRRMGGYILGVDEQGNADAISMGGSTYFAPAVSLLNSDFASALRQGDLEEAGAEGIREVFRSSPPYFQQIAERLEEKDYFSNKAWRDESGHSQVKAPTFLWWFMNKPGDEPNAFEKLLGLTPVMDSDGNLRHVTIDPNVSWWLDWIPGMSAVMQDVSSMADPRQADTATGIMLPTGKELNLSLEKGLMRQAGVPKYQFQISTAQEQEIRKVREALGDSLTDLTGDSLSMDQFGNIGPNFRSERGQKLQQDIDQWRREAQEQGLGTARARGYVNQRLIRHYLQEWRIMELSERLKALQGKAPAMAEAPKPLQDSTRYGRQRAIEDDRADRELRKLLGIR